MFQRTINVNPAFAVAGDFATWNPRNSAIPAPGGPSGGGFVAGAGGLTVGLFAWADTATNLILLNAGSGLPTGFCHRNLQAMITAYLGSASNVVPAGFGFGDLFSQGDFWVTNAGSGSVTVGMKAFASNTTGQVQFAAAGATVAGNTETKWYAKTAGLTTELIIMSDTAP